MDQEPKFQKVEKKLSAEEHAMDELEKFVQLSGQYPDNPLFTNTFENVPSNFVNVYQYTDVDNIESIGEFGLQIKFKEISAAPNIKRVDTIIDKYAPPGISRIKAQYAYPHKSQTGMGKFRDKPRVKLEIKVDPMKVRVANLETVTYASEYLERGDMKDAEERARSYWKESLTLKQYIEKLGLYDRELGESPEAYQERTGDKPLSGVEWEVIIPYDISPMYIRAIPG